MGSLLGLDDLGIQTIPKAIITNAIGAFLLKNANCQLKSSTNTPS